MSSREILVRRLLLEATLPTYAQPGDSGLDLHAVEKTLLPPGKRCVVRTGLAIEIPIGLEAQVRSRSGLAKDHGVVVFNSPGTIDSGYRGEILVLLANFGEDDFEIVAGMRIAQLVFCDVSQVTLREASHIGKSTRGERGLGSTGGYARRKPLQKRDY
jgi:dUTP pyrophosphatase